MIKTVKKFFFKNKEILSNMNYQYQDELKMIQDYKFPDVVKKRTKEELGIDDELFELVALSLKDYFLVIKDNGEFEMFDKAADILWHNFLIDTKSYMEFCSSYIGFYVHHIPYETKKMYSNDYILNTIIKKYTEVFKETIFKNNLNYGYSHYRNKVIHDFIFKQQKLNENKYKTIQINYIDKLNCKLDNDLYFFTSINIQHKYSLINENGRLILSITKLILNDKILSQKEFRLLNDIENYQIENKQLNDNKKDSENKKDFNKESNNNKKNSDEENTRNTSASAMVGSGCGSSSTSSCSGSVNSSCSSAASSCGGGCGGGG